MTDTAAADTLPAPDSIPAALDGRVAELPDGGAELPGGLELLGNDAHAASGEAVLYGYDPVAGHITASTAFGITALAVFVLYCLVIYHYRSQIAELTGAVWNKSNMEKTLAGHNRLFEVFVRSLMLLGMGVLSLAVIKYADLRWGSFITDGRNDWELALACLAVPLCTVLVWLLQNTMLRTAGSASLSSAFTTDIINVRRLAVSTATLTLAPVATMYALSGETSGQILFWITTAGAAGSAFFFMVRICQLFIERKISIFYWILYLCAVELFPVSLPLLILIRHLN